MDSYGCRRFITKTWILLTRHFHPFMASFFSILLLAEMLRSIPSSVLSWMVPFHFHMVVRMLWVCLLKVCIMEPWSSVWSCSGDSFAMGCPPCGEMWKSSGELENKTWVLTNIWHLGFKTLSLLRSKESGWWECLDYLKVSILLC